MNRFSLRASFLLLLSGTPLCVAAPVAEPDIVAFYFGEVGFYSPDGLTSRGQTTSLIRRTISPSKSKIVEEVLQPPRAPGEAPIQSETTLTRQESSSCLSAGDRETTFTGFLCFQGEAWKWNDWTYGLKFTGGGFAGGRLLGYAELSTQALKTHKILFDKNDVPTMLIVENLSSISEEEYARRRKEIAPEKSAR